MANVVKTIKVRATNGSVQEVPIGTQAKYVTYNNGKTGQEVFASIIDITGLAQAFNPDDPYQAGDYVSSGRQIYKITQAKPAGRTWDQTSKQKVILASELKSLKEAGSNTPVNIEGLISYTEIAPAFNENNTYAVGDYVYNPTDGKFYRFKAKHDSGVSWEDSQTETSALTIQINKSIKEAQNNINNIIKVSSTQPTETTNKLWINDTAEQEISVPTQGDFDALRLAVKRITFDLNQHELILSTINI